VTLDLHYLYQVNVSLGVWPTDAWWQAASHSAVSTPRAVGPGRT